MTPITLELPFPPSVNHIWQKRRGRITLSDEARIFRDAAKWMISQQIVFIRPRPFITWPVTVALTICRPNNKKRDLDNMAKAILDAITKAKIWKDDSLVHDLRLRWGEIITGGKAVVTIKNLEAQ